MINFEIDYKHRYDERTATYSGDLKGFTDFLFGMLAIEDVSVSAIRMEDDQQ